MTGTSSTSARPCRDQTDQVKTPTRYVRRTRDRFSLSRTRDCPFFSIPSHWWRLPGVQVDDQDALAKLHHAAPRLIAVVVFPTPPSG